MSRNKPSSRETEIQKTVADTTLTEISLKLDEQTKLVTGLKNELINTHTLYKLSRSLNEFDTLEDAIQKAADLLADTLDFDRLNIIQFDLSEKVVTNFYRGGPGREESVEVSFEELQEGLSGWVLKNIDLLFLQKRG